MSGTLMLIADTCGVIGMGFFLWAEIKQLWKILRTHRVTGISHTAYTSKLAAIGFTSITLAIATLYMSLAVIVAEGVIVLWVLYLMKKYRGQKKEFFGDKAGDSEFISKVCAPGNTGIR